MALSNVYWDWTALQRDDAVPSILAIGDSWFWYPFPGGSLLSRLGPLVAPTSQTILAFGNNGAKARDYVAGKYRSAVRTALRLHGRTLSAVFLSGGGNDFAGFNDLRPMLNRDCSLAQSVGDCFASGPQAGTLDALMQEMAQNYRMLVEQMLAATPAACRIVLHNYDFAIPTGQGLFGHEGSWLKPALDNARVPPQLQRESVRQVLLRFTEVLRETVQIEPARIVLVDSSGTLNDADWANELHPTPAGFTKIAQERWLPVLQTIGVA